MNEEKLRNIIRNHFEKMLLEQDIELSPYTPEEEKFLAKFFELKTTSIGILYSKDATGVREFLNRSGKDFNLTPNIFHSLLKQGTISIVPYGGYARNEDYTVKLNIPLEDLEGLSSDDAGGEEEPPVATEESVESSKDLAKLLVTEAKKSKKKKKSKVHTKKSRTLKRLPKGYVNYLERIIQILGNKLKNEREREQLVADILDNLAHNFGLTPKQVYRSFIYYRSQNRLANIVRESLNEQTTDLCKGNNAIKSPLVKIYPKDPFFPIQFFMRINFGATETTTNSYEAALLSLKSQILDSPQIPEVVKTEIDNGVRELTIPKITTIRSAASSHYNGISLQPTHDNKGNELSTTPNTQQYGNDGKIGSSAYNKNLKFAQGRWASFSNYISQNKDFNILSTTPKKEEIKIIDPGS